MADSSLHLSVRADCHRFKASVEARKHRFISDEPPAAGGTDEGPSPLEYQLGALAGCENVVAMHVAQEMGFQLDGLLIAVEGTLDLRGLRGEPGVRPFFEQVAVHVQVDTPESEERVQELQAKVDQRCPTYTMMKAAGVQIDADWHKTITSPDRQAGITQLHAASPDTH